jgi:hypothetical protein
MSFVRINVPIESYGNTLLHLVLLMSRHRSGLPVAKELILLLCKRGADPLLKNNMGESATSLARQSPFSDKLQLLLQTCMSR